jgi:hypothetical protein
MKRILITGAAGKIGNTLRKGLRERYAVLRLSDIAPLDPARAGEEIVRADLSDLAEVEAAMRDVDCVVHLGAIAGEDMAQPARRRAAGRMLHRCARLSFHRRLRRLQQHAQPLPQCRRRVPRLSAAGQIGGLCGRHPVHPGHRGCDLAGIPRRRLYANGVRRRPCTDRVAGHPVAVAGKSDCAIPPAFPAHRNESTRRPRDRSWKKSTRRQRKVPGPFNATAPPTA